MRRNPNNSLSNTSQVVKINQTFDIKPNKINPISVDEGVKNNRDISDSYQNYNNNIFSKGQEVEDVCAICGQPFEIHSLDYNFELVMLHNKYQEMLDDTSIDDRGLALNRPNTPVSVHSVKSMLRNHYERMKNFTVFNPKDERSRLVSNYDQSSGKLNLISVNNLQNKTLGDKVKDENEYKK